MNYRKCYLPLLMFIILASFKTAKNEWTKKSGKSFDVNYTPTDKSNIKEYSLLISSGIKEVEIFFDSAYRQKFQVYIHPDRISLDSTWQKNWNMPGFKSECWMVASGVADRIDIISPKTWDKESCEHSYADKEKMQKLLTHELVHVFHGQLNVSPDFSKTENMDWFVEGLATYVSGQLDSATLASVKELVDTRTYPKMLDIFWEGKLRYGLSGSMVRYIDKTYGRQMIQKLLPLNKKEDILKELEISEAGLLAGWAKYMK